MIYSPGLVFDSINGVPVPGTDKDFYMRNTFAVRKISGEIKETDEFTQEVNQETLHSGQSDTPRSAGSWDLPSGPVAWDDTDLTFEQLLHYADLTLTEEEENGLLTDRIIASCASYLTRSPASKCHIVAKLCLSNKNLSDIRIIAHHRFLQYIDFSWNCIRDISALGNLPYLMYLDVSHNLLERVLQFKPPWNLTYVNYSYNEVWQIDDLSDFWSLSYLDLSHNKISKIQGLDSLRYLRYLNLSHNKIARFENLNHMRITDLNLECNIISTFETGEDVGLKTMMNLSSLCLNNNLISDLEFLRDAYHLKKLELQGNLIANLMGLDSMRSLRKMKLLDLTGNPVTEFKPYRHLLLNILPDLKFLDQTEVDGSEKAATYMGMKHVILGEAEKMNSRLTVLDQLNDSVLDQDVPPIDEPSYPLVILVGPCASKKKIIASKLAEKYPDKICIGKLHTTRELLEPEKAFLIKIGKEEFHEKAKNGHFISVMENVGHFYGFSREMLSLAASTHRLCLTFMDLGGALIVSTYGIQPHLVLTMLKSETEHRERLKKNYGPILTYLGAAYISKRELCNTRASNVRRIKEIIYDIIEKVVLWVDGRHNLSFAQCSVSYGEPSKTIKQSIHRGKDVNGSKKISSNTDYLLASRTRQSILSERDFPLRFECREACHPTTCGLQEEFKQIRKERQEAVDYNSTISYTTNSSNEVKEEESGTSSTSYSAEVLPPLRIAASSLDDEGSFGEEDDIFADWSSLFVDWDEVNVDPVAVEQAAEYLCEGFVNRVLTTRSAYQCLNVDNPGLFSRVLFTDNERDAEKNLTDFLRELWRAMPAKRRLFDIEKDFAYQQMVPKRLKRLMEMIRKEQNRAPDNTVEEEFFPVRSPRTIVTQMQMMGYQTTTEE